jgi:hypothetical protein
MSNIVDPSQLTIGMTVFHAYFGKGIVCEYTEDLGVKIDFSDQNTSGINYQASRSQYFRYVHTTPTANKLEHLYDRPIMVVEKAED